MTTVKGLNLFVCFDAIVKFNTRNVTFTFVIFEFLVIFGHRVTIRKKITTETYVGSSRTRRWPPIPRRGALEWKFFYF